MSARFDSWKMSGRHRIGVLVIRRNYWIRCDDLINPLVAELLKTPCGGILRDGRVTGDSEANSAVRR